MLIPFRCYMYYINIATRFFFWVIFIFFFMFFFLFQINRNFDLKCFLYSNHVFTDLVQYEFEPCLQDKVNMLNIIVIPSVILNFCLLSSHIKLQSDIVLVFFLLSVHLSRFTTLNYFEISILVCFASLPTSIDEL